MEKKLKSVFSPPRKRHKSFDVIDIKNKRLCFKKPLKVLKDEKDIYREYNYDPDGPLVITHLQKKIKHKIEKKPIPPKTYMYFINHRDCPETLLYTHDLLHPKILRHHSKNKKIKIPKPTDNQLISSIASNSIRETNRFGVFMSLKRKGRITII